MSEREWETTADVGGDRSVQPDEAGTKTCAHCGATIDEYEWFPIRGREGDDGEFRVFSFCSQECVEFWNEPEP